MKIKNHPAFADDIQNKIDYIDELVSVQAPWRDLPERYGSWKTVYSRFRKWIDDGILDNIFRILSLEAELEELSIDASIIQAHQHSAGAKKGGLQMKSGIAVEEPAPKSMRQQMPMDIQFI